MSTLVATLSDYSADFQRLLRPASFRRLAEQLADACVARFLAAFRAMAAPDGAKRGGLLSRARSNHSHTNSMGAWVVEVAGPSAAHSRTSSTGSVRLPASGDATAATAAAAATGAVVAACAPLSAEDVARLAACAAAIEDSIRALASSPRVFARALQPRLLVSGQPPPRRRLAFEPFSHCVRATLTPSRPAHA